LRTYLHARAHQDRVIFDMISSKIQMRQRWALCYHFCQSFGSSSSDVIVLKIQVRQRRALCQHSCKPPGPFGSELIVRKIKMDY
jgi:hypothetical protein